MIDVEFVPLYLSLKSRHLSYSEKGAGKNCLGRKIIANSVVLAAKRPELQGAGLEAERVVVKVGGAGCLRVEVHQNTDATLMPDNALILAGQVSIIENLLFKS